MNYLGAILVPLRMSIYQPFTPLGIKRNLVHKLKIRLAKHSALINPFLNLK